MSFVLIKHAKYENCLDDTLVIREYFIIFTSTETSYITRHYAQAWVISTENQRSKKEKYMTEIFLVLMSRFTYWINCNA